MQHRRWGWALASALVLGGCYGGVDSADTDSGTGDGGESGSGGDDTQGDDGMIPEDVEPDDVPEPLAVRLNDVQYRYTVLDLFGVALTEEEEGWLPRDVPIDGHYSTAVEGQVFSPQYVLAYAYIARSIAARLDPAGLLADHGDCTDTSVGCIEAFARGLGRRIYRRPLTDEEVQIYVDLADAIAQSPEIDDDDVVEGIVQRMMQAPQFLYRLEHETDGTPGDLRRLDGYEVASRLSYFLWQSTPDEALLAFGADDYDAEALAEQIERMIADPKFARTREVFWGDYSLASVSSFATADEVLAQEHRQSLLATFDRISGADGDPQPLSAIFDGRDFVLSGSIAELAGATPKGDGLEVYDVSEVEERLGVVTHPSFIAAIGTTSFVGRGLFMTERLLCQPMSPPPGDADTAERIMETSQQTSEMTPREASEFRFGLEPVCLACHTQFEPIAYAFERYQMSGEFGLTDDQGRDLFSDGMLPAQGDRPEIAFADAPELLTALAAEDTVQACLVQNMMEYGTGHLAHGDTFVDEAFVEYRDRGETFDALVQSVAGSDLLSLMRTVQP